MQLVYCVFIHFTAEMKKWFKFNNFSKSREGRRGGDDVFLHERRESLHVDTALSLKLYHYSFIFQLLLVDMDDFVCKILTEWGLKDHIKTFKGKLLLRFSAVQ